MGNKYCFGELISNGFALIITRIFYPKARLIRRPLYLRGRKSIEYGEGLTIGHACRFDLDGTKKTLTIGKNCEFGDNTHIVARESVTIGDNVLVASKVFISDTSHGVYNGENQDSPFSIPKDRPLVLLPVEIGNNVWIGENVVILPGTKIGDGCIIGANSVVKGIFKNNCIIVGVPATVKKYWGEDENRWLKNDQE